MITLNLLPDIKKEYLKANRTKSMILTVAFFVSLGSVAIVIMFSLYVFGFQKLQTSSSQDTINESIVTLNETEDLDKIVTVQNQLKSLPSLEDGTIKANNLFDYLATVTPNDISLTSVNVDFEDYTIEIRGFGTDFKNVNTFVDTLKNASYTYEDNSSATLAFSSVVLGSIVADDDSVFRISLSYDPKIFDPNAKGMKLTVPEITSTRSQTEKPKSLFDNAEAQ